MFAIPPSSFGYITALKNHRTIIVIILGVPIFTANQSWKFLSAHKLQTECGRYSGEEKEDRLCTTCNVAEDEIHFFCDSKKKKNIQIYMMQRFQNIINFNINGYFSNR